MFRHLLLILFILLLGTSQKSKIDKELEDLREFYDPDTVDLMQWLEQNTKPVILVITFVNKAVAMKGLTLSLLHLHFEF